MSGSDNVAQAGLQLGPEDQALFRELCALKRTTPAPPTVSPATTSVITEISTLPSSSQQPNPASSQEEEGQLEWSLRRALTGFDGESKQQKSQENNQNNNMFFVDGKLQNNANANENSQVSHEQAPMENNYDAQMQFYNQMQMQNNHGRGGGGLYVHPMFMNNQTMGPLDAGVSPINGGGNVNGMDPKYYPYFQQHQAMSQAMGHQYPYLSHPMNSYDTHSLQEFYLMGGRTEYIDGMYIRLDKNGGKYIGAYSPVERKKRINRFHEKRKRCLRSGLACQHAGQMLLDQNKLNKKNKKNNNKNSNDVNNATTTGDDGENDEINNTAHQNGVRAERMIRYGVRKQFADSRMRVKGRFVKKEDENLLRELMSIA